MKKLITGIIIALSTTFVLAQSTSFNIDRTLVCDDTKKIFNELMKGEYKESPLWGGVGEKTKFILLVNQSTGTWTIIQFTPGVGCILGSGEGSTLSSTEKKKLGL